jgi:predicted Zn-dependent protease with MMP-like domain
MLWRAVALADLAMLASPAMTPDTDTFLALAEAAISRLPDEFRVHLDGVTLRVEEFADRATLDDLGIDDRWDLTGLYHGQPMGEQSIWSTGELPPVITLYRQPLIAEWRETGVELDDLITHVIVHEVGHHFGLSDDDMEAIEGE